MNDRPTGSVNTGLNEGWAQSGMAGESTTHGKQDHVTDPGLTPGGHSDAKKVVDEKLGNNKSSDDSSSGPSTTDKLKNAVGMGKKE